MDLSSVKKIEKFNNSMKQLTGKCNQAVIIASLEDLIKISAKSLVINWTNLPTRLLMNLISRNRDAIAADFHFWKPSLNVPVNADLTVLFDIDDLALNTKIEFLHRVFKPSSLVIAINDDSSGVRGFGEIYRCSLLKTCRKTFPKISEGDINSDNDIIIVQSYHWWNSGAGWINLYRKIIGNTKGLVSLGQCDAINSYEDDILKGLTTVGVAADILFESPSWRTTMLLVVVKDLLVTQHRPTDSLTVLTNEINIMTSLFYAIIDWVCYLRDNVIIAAFITLKNLIFGQDQTIMTKTEDTHKQQTLSLSFTWLQPQVGMVSLKMMAGIFTSFCALLYLMTENIVDNAIKVIYNVYGSYILRKWDKT